MGDPNQLLFMKRHVARFAGSVLEIGSRDYGNTADVRSLFPSCDYLGIDMSEGAGVDLVLDFSQDFGVIESRLGGRRFDMVVCLSVLEHTQNPFLVADHISRILNVGGMAVVSVPFVWDIHGYPDDFWRFTPEGVRRLFPGLHFPPELSEFCTKCPGEHVGLDEAPFAVQPMPLRGKQSGAYSFLEELFIRVARRIGFLDAVFRYDCVYPPVMLNMIGRKEG